MWGDYESIPEHSTAEDHGEAVKSVLQQGGFLGRDTEQLFPYGIYTIPEISMVRNPSLPPSLPPCGARLSFSPLPPSLPPFFQIGKTEEQLTAEKVPYEVGIANYTFHPLTPSSLPPSLPPSLPSFRSERLKSN